MAVPKKKTSKQKSGTRRSHDALSPIMVSLDKVSGEAKLPHHVSKVDGMYNGKKMVIKKSAPTVDNQPAEQ